MVVCPYCKQKVKKGLPFCPHCGNSLQGVKKKKSPLLFIFPIILLLIVGLVIAGIFFFSDGNGKNGGTDTLIWSDGYKYNFVRSTNIKDIEPIYLDDTVPEGYAEEYIARFSPDKRYLYYFTEYSYDSCGKLCRAEIEKLRGNEGDEQFKAFVADDVFLEHVKIYDDGTAGFMRRGDQDSYEICYFDGTDSSVIVRDVDSFYPCENKEIIYTKVEGENVVSIYYDNLGDEEEPHQLVSGATSYCSVINENCIVCTGNYNEDRDTYDLYVTGKDKKATQIASNVRDYRTCVAKEGDDVQIYYTTVKGNSIHLSDVVTYDGYQEDKALQEPTKDNPLYFDPDAGWFGSYTEAYYTAKDAYWEAQDRLRIFEDLKEVPYSLDTIALHSYNFVQEKSKDICGNIAFYDCAYDYDKDTCAVGYVKGMSELNPINITQLMQEDTYHLEERIIREIKKACTDFSAVYLKIASEKVAKIELKGVATSEYHDNMEIFLFDDGKKIAYGLLGSPEDEYTDDVIKSDIYVGNIKDGVINDVDSVLHEVVQINTQKNELFMFRDDGIYIYSKEGAKKLTDNVNYRYKAYEDGSIYYIDDNEDALYQLDNGEDKIKIANDVRSFIVLNDGNVLYNDYNGTLKKYYGKESITLAENVYKFWHGNEKE